MEKENYLIVSVIQRYLIDDLTEEERQELMTWVEADAGNRLFFEAICSGKGLDERVQAFRGIDTSKVLQAFNQRIAYRKPRRSFRIRWNYVAMISLPLLLVLWIWLTPDVSSVKAAPTSWQGGMLRMPNGDTIYLQEGRSEVLVANKQLAAADSGVVCNTEKEEKYIRQLNHLEVPRGCEYALILPDSSKVYLNSASILKYPPAFDSEKREVYLSGEAYFEVKKDDRPFCVVTEGVCIQVHSGSLNASTRREGLVQTVLKEGDVVVQGKLSPTALEMTAGQLAVFSIDGKFVEIRKVDVNPFVAWRDGKFAFDNQPLKDIMTTLSLHYSMNVVFVDEEVKQKRFTGEMDNSVDLFTILRAISKKTKVDISVEGMTITLAKRKKHDKES